MSIIICIVGETGSNTFQVAKLLEKDGYNRIKPFTTKTPFEDDGNFFYARSYEEYLSRARDSLLIYHWYESKNYFWVPKSQIKEDEINIFVTTPMGVGQLQASPINGLSVYILYLKMDKSKRIEKLMEMMGCSITDAGNVSARPGMLAYEQNISNVLEEVTNIINREERFYRYFKADWVIDDNKSDGITYWIVKNIIEDTALGKTNFITRTGTI